MTWVRAGDPFGLIAYLTHFYTNLKLLLVPPVTVREKYFYVFQFNFLDH